MATNKIRTRSVVVISQNDYDVRDISECIIYFVKKLHIFISVIANDIDNSISYCYHCKYSITNVYCAAQGSKKGNL